MTGRQKDGDDRDEIIHFDSVNNPSEVTFSRPPAPITADDLKAALHVLLPEEMVDERLEVWVADIGQPGVTWTLDIMWAVAQLSEEHARRITEYLGWTREELESEYRRIYLERGH